MKILFIIFNITLIVINFYPVLLFGQDSKNLTWKICAEIKNPDVIAYAVFDSSGRFQKNVLIHSGLGKPDTINLHSKNSTIPGFINNCDLEKIQLDGNRTKEIIVTYSNSTKVFTDDSLSSIEKSYTIKQIWNIDTQKRLMIFYTNFYYLQITPFYESFYVETGKPRMKLAGYNRDSCFYKLNFSITKKQIIKIEKIQETGNCWFPYLFTIDEGYYFYKKGELEFKDLSEE